MVKGMVRLLESGVEKGELKEEVVAEELAHELFIIIRGITLDWLWGGTKEPRGGSKKTGRKGDLWILRPDGRFL